MTPSPCAASIVSSAARTSKPSLFDVFGAGYGFQPVACFCMGCVKNIFAMMDKAFLVQREDPCPTTSINAFCLNCPEKRSWEKVALGLTPTVTERLATQVKALVDDGIQVGVVVGGGNIFRGPWLVQRRVWIAHRPTTWACLPPS